MLCSWTRYLTVKNVNLANNSENIIVTSSLLHAKNKLNRCVLKMRAL